nr:hypothetical protein PanWU01x14_084430 [Ipomoea trifida]
MTASSTASTPIPSASSPSPQLKPAKSFMRPPLSSQCSSPVTFPTSRSGAPSSEFHRRIIRARRIHMAGADGERVTAVQVRLIGGGHEGRFNGGRGPIRVRAFQQGGDAAKMRARH